MRARTELEKAYTEAIKQLKRALDCCFSKEELIDCLVNGRNSEIIRSFVNNMLINRQSRCKQCPRLLNERDSLSLELQNIQKNMAENQVGYFLAMIKSIEIDYREEG